MTSLFMVTLSLCQLTFAGWRDPYMNKHDSVKEAKAKANNHVTLTRILPWKSWFTTHLPLLSWNTFTHWNQAYYMLSKRKKQEKRDGKKVKGKSPNYCVTFKLKTIQNFTFCTCALNFRSLCYFGIWIRRLWTLQPIKRLFGLSFSSL